MARHSFRESHLLQDVVYSILPSGTCQNLAIGMIVVQSILQVVMSSQPVWLST